MNRFKKTTFSVLFIVKKARLLKNGEAPIAVRVTVNGQISEILVKRSVPLHLWNQAKECSNGTGHVARELNHYLETVRAKIYRIHRELEVDGKPITAKSVRDKLYGRDDSSLTICGIYEEHNEKCRALIGNGFSAVTVRKFDTSLSHLRDYIKHQYRREDMLLLEIDGRFVRDHEFYLKAVARMQHNSALKHLKNLKKVVRIAIANDWITKDPFFGIQFKHDEIDPEFLTKEELDTLRSKEFDSSRLDAVRDAFVFCCFCGFAFIDFKHLTPDHIVKDNDGKLWIRKARQKTNNMCNVPLLAPALQLIEKYKDHPECVKNGTLLPTMSNQKCNAYLKEIAEICGIKKTLSTHCARHTCATTVLLANGVTMENVAKILGHASTKMTQHYARVLDSSIMRDMAAVENCFN